MWNINPGWVWEEWFNDVIADENVYVKVSPPIKYVEGIAAIENLIESDLGGIYEVAEDKLRELSSGRYEGRDVYGLLRKEKNGWNIYVLDKLNYPEKVKVIAHEIFALLNGGEEGSVDSDEHVGIEIASMEALRYLIKNSESDYVREVAKTAYVSGAYILINAAREGDEFARKVVERYKPLNELYKSLLVDELYKSMSGGVSYGF